MLEEVAVRTDCNLTIAANAELHMTNAAANQADVQTSRSAEEDVTSSAIDSSSAVYNQIPLLGDIYLNLATSAQQTS